MKNRKIWVLLNVLTKGEAQHFIRWLRAELNGSQASILALAEILVSHLPRAPLAKQLQEIMSKKDKKVKKYFTKYLTILTSYIEHFLMCRALQFHPQEADVLLLKELNRRKTLDAFELESQRIHRSLDQLPQDASYYYKRFQLQAEKRKHALRSKHKLDSTQLLVMNDSIDYWWLYQKILTLCTACSAEERTHQSILPDSSLEFEHWQEKYARKEAQPLLTLYARLFEVLQNPSVSEANILLNELKQGRSIYAREDAASCYIMLLNLFINQLNETGTPKMIELVLELYIWGFKQKYIYQGKYLPAGHYKNFITICVKGERFELAKKYLYELKADLPLLHREEVFTLALSTLLAGQGQFQEVVDLLSQWKRGQLSNRLHAKALLMEAYYELGETYREQLITQVDNWLKYFRKIDPEKARMSKNNYQSWLNRFRFLKRLAEVSDMEPKRLRRLKKEIEKEKYLGKKAWFLQKINALLKGR